MQKASNISVEQVRKELGVEEDVKLVIFNFGGQVSIACVFPGMLLVQGI